MNCPFTNLPETLASPNSINIIPTNMLLMSGKQITLFDFASPKQSNENEDKRDKEKINDENTEIKIREKSNHEGKHQLESKVAEEGKLYYLIQIDYDGSKQKAVCKLFDPETNSVVYYEDKTNHKPYFLVELELEKVKNIQKIVKDNSFDHFETVSKIDPYTGKRITLTKIVTKDPLAVARMREVVPKAYEAHIHYANNYAYDLGLIPGFPHVIEHEVIRPAIPELTKNDRDEVLKAFSGEDEVTKEMVLKWYPYFEAPVFTPKIAAIDIEVFTLFKGRVPDSEKAELPVISIGIATSDGKKVVLVLNRNYNKIDKLNDIEVQLFDSEREMLKRFFEIISDYPVILTFNGDDFDIPYLFYRSLKLGISDEEIPISITQEKTTFVNSIHIDLYLFFTNKAVKNYAFEGKYNEYTLDAISQALLGMSKVKIDDTVTQLEQSKLIEYNFRDAEITLRLVAENNNLVWKLMVIFARISKLGIEDLTRKEISSWVRNLYYWEHRQRNWLIPLKEEIAQKTSIKRTKSIIKGKGYKGAVVIEPPKGVFFNVTVLDFASLYPSIIKNWNLSYETVDKENCKEIKDIADETGEIIHRVCFDRPGITAVITGLLRDFRVKIYKKKAKSAKDKELKEYYDVVQRAMKVFINATYGVFGAETFPLYAPAVAESTTAIGRYVITTTSNYARELGLRVLYGDTDSLFIYNPQSQILEQLINWVKKQYSLDLEVDKTYKLIAFPGLKKNYFGVYPDGKAEIKGMLAKKRNTPEFVRKAFLQVKDTLSNMQSEDDIPKVRKEITSKIKGLYNGLKNKDFNLDELAFKVMLSKKVDSYDKNTPQHVKAAQMLIKENVQVMPRDIISFVKVKGKEGVKPVQLSKLPEVDIPKYVETIRSTFEQLLLAFDVSWDEIESVTRIENFFS
ncbi:DNA polymerase I [Sulfolobales archaeon HS-7]|nr:DNA polymerase I [Sulfolobales archaeon HS-7]